MNRCPGRRRMPAAALGFVALGFGAIALALRAPRAAADSATSLSTNAASELNPRWSPDGSRIAFTRETALNPTLFVLPLAGGPAQAIAPTSVGVLHPEWSPDGSAVMFSRLGVLWSLPIAGGSLSQITSPLDGGHPGEAPAWSSTNRIAIQTKFGSETNFAIGTVLPSGGVTQRITPEGAPCLFPSWSPDGTRLVYVLGSPGNLVTRVVDGGAETPLISWASSETQPEWSPLGGWVAFASNVSGNFDIWIVPAAGGDAIQITDDPASDIHPTWSPDETRLAFSPFRSGTFDLWVIDVSSLPVKSTSWSAIKGTYAE